MSCHNLMLVYSPMEEPVETAGWEKASIEYAISNHKRILSQIKSIAKSKSNDLKREDIEDIYSNILLYLHTCDDYNITKAIERSNSDTIVSLESYINTCVKCCVLRYCTTRYKEEKGIIHESVFDEDGKELSLFDSIEDTHSVCDIDDLHYDISTLCKCSEPLRYKYGIDIYMLFYIRIKTIHEQNMWEKILAILGISKHEILQLKKLGTEEELLMSFAKSIALAGHKRALSVLRKYVFGASIIDNAIKMHCAA